MKSNRQDTIVTRSFLHS